VKALTLNSLSVLGTIGLISFLIFFVATFHVLLEQIFMIGIQLFLSAVVLTVVICLLYATFYAFKETLKRVFK